MAENGTFDWNGTIENDGQGFVTLDEGDYEYIVSGFERGWYEGSDKVPPCNKALLTLSIDTPEGVAQCKVTLLLCQTMEWKLSSFFRSIGQKKHGEKLVMDWDKVLGANGAAHFKPREYIGQNDGEKHKTNNVDYFIDWNPTFMKNLRNKKTSQPVQASIDDEEIPF